MQNEFPFLKHHNYQNEFLSDWWSRKKLFIGKRRSGKTTLILCELRRFLNRDMDCVVLVPRRMDQKRIFRSYEDFFGEKPDCEVRSFSEVRKGYLRGRRCDVVLLDEAQELAFEEFSAKVLPMDPMFVRFCACKSSMDNIHYLLDQDGESKEGFFDSVYRV